MLGNNQTIIPTVQVGAGMPLQSVSAVGQMPTLQVGSGIPIQSTASLYNQMSNVQVGAGIPIQSTASIAQNQIPQQSLVQPQLIQSSLQQQTMAPVESGSILGVPPGTMVSVKVGNSIVQVPTQPVATQSVHMSMQPVPQYQTQSVPVPIETQQIDMEPNVELAPQYGETTTPTVRTLQPRVVRNNLAPQYKTVTLPAKVVTTRLPPIGPPPTPEINFQLPPPSLPPVQQVHQSYIPPPPVPPAQPVQSVVMTQPVISTVVPQYQLVSVPVANYQTASIPQVQGPKFGTTSVIAQY